MNIVEFLQARIDEDEIVANAAATSADGHEWEYSTSGRAMDGHGWVCNSWGVVLTAEQAGTGSVRQPVGQNIARHDPARVLREVAAKRALIADHSLSNDPCDEHDANYESIPCGVITALASAYSDHPDFQAASKQNTG